MPARHEDKEWASLSAAARYLKVGDAKLNALIDAGKLTVRAIPMTYRRVLWADVERLAEEHTTPARAN